MAFDLWIPNQLKAGVHQRSSCV